MAQVKLATLDVTGKIPLAQIPDGISGGSGTDATARAAALAAQNDIDSLQSSVGLPNGVASLGSNGLVTNAQIAHLIPILQNPDGTWPARPATTASILWMMLKGSSQPPVGTGTTAGGVGMVNQLDRLVDATGTLGV